MSRGRSRIVLSALSFCAFGILIALGVWQMERRAWKNGLIARFQAALVKPPVRYDPANPPGAKAREFMHVRVKGTPMNAQAVRLLTATPEAARSHTQEGFGYLIFTPVKSGDKAVFVNRGFVPQSLAEDQSLFPKGEVELTGIVRRTEAPGWFTPPPEPAKRLTYAADIRAMAQAVGFAEREAVSAEYIEAEPAPDAAQWPQARDPHALLSSIPNRHLEYSLTWLALAATLCVMFGVYIVRPRSTVTG